MHFYDDRELSTGDDLAKSEQRINRARADRERRDREDDKRMRAQLECASPSGGRLNLVDILNGVSHQRAKRELPGVAALQVIRETQKLSRRTPEQHNLAHARFEALQRKQSAEFNRLHPLSRASNFETGADDPGNVRGSRFEQDERYTPDLAEAKRLLGTAGRLIADARTRASHWPSGSVEAIEAAFLLDAARAVIEAVRARAGFPAGRRDT